MKHIDPALAQHLAGEVTTLARCWALNRLDGVVFGFTDHDRDITFGGVTFRASTGLDAAEASAELGFAVGGGDVAGALNSAGLSEDDLAAGRYDGASVTSWLVNWDDPSQRLVTATSVIGEVKRTDVAFVAELRSTAHRFDEERGRLFTQNCTADLGDANCGYAIGTYYGAVESTDGRLSLTALSLAIFPDGWLTGGKITFTGGPNDGFATEVKLHRLGAGEAEIALWQLPPYDIAVAHEFSITPGCDKRFATCRDRFANYVNFRGFPHMPGNDVIVRGIKIGEPGMDGGSMFR